MAETFWFLAYTYKSKPVHEPRPLAANDGIRNDRGFGSKQFPDIDEIANVALAGIHPLVWLSTPGEMSRRYFVRHAVFFHEIDEATFNEIGRLNYINAEDFRTVGVK